MSLSSSTLSALQKAGAAVFAADGKLKKTVKEFAERVHAAVAANPYDPENDRLMEAWKTAARLSQTFAGIEAEIRRAYQIAAELNGKDQPSVVPDPVLPASTRAVKKGVPGQNAATVKAAKAAAKKIRQTSKAVKDAPVAPTRSTEATVAASDALTSTGLVVKPKQKTPRSKNLAAKYVEAAKPVKASKGASASTNAQALSGNPAKLLAHLTSLLNANDFTTFSQTAASRETGIPLGSMTAATKKLLEMGRLTAGPTGSFKLADAPQPVAP
ncbi:MAG: hypothetical protein Q7K57_32205 [Burkholderiaceae bacterium]|nr:hypothetical protein [Burkholderiaceae bacterium]